MYIILKNNNSLLPKPCKQFFSLFGLMDITKHSQRNLFMLFNTALTENTHISRADLLIIRGPHRSVMYIHYVTIIPKIHNEAKNKLAAADFASCPTEK